VTKKVSTKYKIRNQEKIYFVSFAVINWIDVFVRNDYKNIIIESLQYCQKNKGLEIYAWCIMTSHVHLIIGTVNNPMENILRDLKSFTSTKLRKAIEDNMQESRKEWMLWMMKRAGSKNSNNTDFQFWQQNNHPIELWDNYMMQQKLDYIHNNPVEAGFVDEPEFYLYSSARDYTDEKGLLDIKLIM
jgi:putative transposase